jgi:hypothetical protein
MEKPRSNLFGKEPADKNYLAAIMKNAEKEFRDAGKYNPVDTGALKTAQ